MAFRPITFLASALLLLALLAVPVQACFGPKLFVGVGADVQEELLFALVTLYVQEKTGVESTPVAIGASQRQLDLLTDEKVDLVFMPVNESTNATVFQLAGLPLLVTGPRPVEDLQFTTVLPAISKLNRLMTTADIDLLLNQVRSGKSAMAVARKFLMDNRWI